MLERVKSSELKAGNAVCDPATGQLYVIEEIKQDGEGFSIIGRLRSGNKQRFWLGPEASKWRKDR